MSRKLHPCLQALAVAGLLVACGGEGTSFPNAAPFDAEPGRDATLDAGDARFDVNAPHDAWLEHATDDADDDAEASSDAQSEALETGPDAYEDVVDADIDAPIDVVEEDDAGCIEGAHDDGGVCGRTCAGGVWTDDACDPIVPPRQRIAVGERHACLVTAAGGVKCWGANNFGQLGEGDLSNSFVPRDVPGLESGLVEVAASNSSTCALTTEATVKCWGSCPSLGSSGGTFDTYLSPVEVADLTDVVSVRSGHDRNCALSSDGQVHCWGFFYNSSIPDGPLDQPHAVDITGLPLVREITLGSFRACALTFGGAVYCWDSSSPPVLVEGLSSDVRTVVVDRTHACAVMESGTAKCWGSNSWGEVGAPVPNDETLVDVPGLNGLRTIAVGEGRSCAVRQSGEVTCWGRRLWGLLGDGLSDGWSMEPGTVQALGGGVRGISLGYTNTCVELASGAFQCWGENATGEHGTGLSSWLSLPVEVVGLPGGMQAVAAGEDHTCGLTDGGEVKCWGNGGAYQLGSGSLTNSLQAVDVAGINGATAIATGTKFSLAVTGSGGVKCWGRCPVGNDVLSPADEPIPVDVAGLTSGVRSIAAGETHACALTNDGEVKCWGSDMYWKLGGGPNADTKHVVTVPFEEPQRSVVTGRDHTCALSESGGVTCWGNDGFGRLGDGNGSSSQPLPSQVVGLSSGVEAITAGVVHTCALLSSGGVKCWGWNSNGAIGMGTTETMEIDAPVNVVGLSTGVRAIAASRMRTCALMVSGGVKCWGDDGVFGVDWSQPAGAPRDVIGLPSGVRALSLGRNHLCALMDDGTIVCQGKDFEGQSSGMYPGYPHDVAL